MPNRTPFEMQLVRVEPDRNLLEFGATTASLEPRIMDVLAMLASKPGEVFGREVIIDEVWQVEHGADESLTRAVSVIRKTLREMGCEGTFIETIPRRGYRLAQPIKELETAKASAGIAERLPVFEGDTPASPALTGSERKPNSRNMLLFVLSGMVALFAVLLIIMRPNGSETIMVEGEPPISNLSIAVLPLEPFSDDPKDARFSEGITEDLINTLSKTQGLAVAARTSSSSYRGREVDVRDIGEALGVLFLVDGTVRRSGDQVRVTAQLIRTSDGFVIWSDTLEEAVSDTFALEDEIVREIRQALELRLGVGMGTGLTPSSGVDPRAVEFYYDGLQLYGKRFVSNGAVTDSRTALRTAVEIEPEFAKAWSALARIGIGWSSSPLSRDKENFVAILENDIANALALNPDDHTLHAALVRWHAFSTLDLSQARVHLQQTEALAPASIEALDAASLYYWVVGEGEKALALHKQIQRRDPLNDISKLGVAQRQSVLGHYDDAFEFFDACQKSNCLQEGFVGYASAAAIYSGDPQRMARWSETFKQFHAFTKTLPPSYLPKVTEVHGAFFATAFDWPQADSQAEIEQAKAVFERELITNHIGIWGPSFTEILPEETFFATLELAHERNDLFSAPFGFAPFYGANPYPDWVLEHPRYHELWKDPRLALLAEARRANGQTAGLPK